MARLMIGLHTKAHRPPPLHIHRFNGAGRGYDVVKLVISFAGVAPLLEVAIARAGYGVFDLADFGVGPAPHFSPCSARQPCILSDVAQTNTQGLLCPPWRDGPGAYFCLDLAIGI